MSDMLIFGPGYTAGRLAARLTGDGWRVHTIGRQAFDDEAGVRSAIAAARHILSSVPPQDGIDPVLSRYGPALSAAPARWIGYLSSTGVYGDAGGAWVDESAPIGGGRRDARTAADLSWQALHPQARVFRLPGIYGPGRSAFERVAEGRAHRIDLPDQVFSRVHVDDIIAGVIASTNNEPPGVFNLADDHPASQNAVIEHACRLLGRAPPPLLTLDEARLSPPARAFYAENRRVANGKAKRLLGWTPAYPTYHAGLAAILANAPASASTSA